MYKEVVINGDIYPEVQKVELLINQGGGTKASFVETSDSDAANTDIASGKTAYVNGTKITGAMLESSITNSGLLVSATPGNVSNTNQNEISWNGIRGGLTCVMTSSYLGFYKVSNNYISTSQTSLLIGGTAYLGTTPYSIESSNVTVGTGYIRVAHSSMWGDTAIIVSTPGAVYSGQTFAETGTYLRHDGSLYISKLILNGSANIFVNNEISLADANLLAANIKSGVNILGTIGTYTGSSGGGEEFNELVERTISVASGSARSIGAYAFYRCTTLATASFPACTSIDTSAFYSCTSLATASFPACTLIGVSAFASCTSLATISFPLCTSISSGAFISCTCLTTASFPLCKVISMFAFASCTSLATASFPACTSIYSSAFSRCYKLLSLYLLGSSVPKLSNKNAFASTPISNYTTSTGGVYGSIIVQASMLNAFKAATNWSVYSSRFSVWNGTD